MSEAEVTIEGHPWILDPNDHYSLPEDNLILSIGPFITEWVVGYDTELAIAQDQGPGEFMSPHKWFDICYAHGGGWMKFGYWTIHDDGVLLYMDKSSEDDEDADPPLYPIAKTRMGDYWFYFYPHAICALIDDHGNFEVARMDQTSCTQ